jgi:predicted Zn-dependent peptidase
MTPIYHTLANGLNIIHLQTNSQVSYCGFAVNAGTRDENENESGLAHFIEHNLFKGTNKRKARHILNRMENVGGELNAYTAKEETVIYSIFMEKDFNRAAELLSDLIINSQFPKNELEKEKEVVIEEIQTYEDNPSELIYDDFENILFNGHQLGHNILGNKKSLKSFNPDTLKSFVNNYYTAENMIFFVISGLPTPILLRTAEKYFNQIPSNKTFSNRILPANIKPQNTVKKKKTHMSHVLIGGKSYNMFDDRKYPLFLLNNILGGDGMNSRLNLSLREKHGLVYTVESNITSYTDTGVFAIYFGIDSKNREKGISLAERELSILRNKKLTEMQLAQAKKQAIGQLGVATDHKESLALAMGKSFLHFGRYETPEEIFCKIEKISSGQIIETANEIFNPENLFSLIFE